MARGAGGLRHVGAAAARGARAPPTAAWMLQPATGYSKTRCATARWDLSFIAASLLAAVQNVRAQLVAQPNRAAEVQGRHRG